MFNDPLEAAEIVLRELDASTLNEIVQGSFGAATLMRLFTDFLPMVVRIGKGYLKSVAVSGP
ncbi:MAG: hypothetical protein DRO93_13180, partial [Candidatus Thorarchaeota archaeon]